jgi:hypothetical protein
MSIYQLTDTRGNTYAISSAHWKLCHIWMATSC